MPGPGSRLGNGDDDVFDALDEIVEVLFVLLLLLCLGVALVPGVPRAAGRARDADP